MFSWLYCNCSVRDVAGATKSWGCAWRVLIVCKVIIRFCGVNYSWYCCLMHINKIYSVIAVTVWVYPSIMARKQRWCYWSAMAWSQLTVNLTLTSNGLLRLRYVSKAFHFLYSFLFKSSSLIFFLFPLLSRTTNNL